MRKTLIALTSILLLLLSVSFVSAQSYFSLPYQDFKTTLKDHPTGWTQENWKALITVALEWNETSTGYVILHLANSTSTNYYGIQLHFARSITKADCFSLNVLVATKVDPSPSDWVSVSFNDGLNEPILVSLDKGRLYVGTQTDYKKYLGGYTMHPFVLANLRTEASANDVVLGGYVNVAISSFDVIDTESLMTTFINAMIVIIPIVLIVTVMEKVFKKITKIGK